MSDLLAAAAAALGTPEAIVARSAEARATATGQSVEEILAAWAGGETVPSQPAAAVEEEPAEEPAAPEAEQPEVAEVETPEPAVVSPPGPKPAPAPAPVGPYKPPILITPPDNPMTTFYAAIGLFLAMFLVGLVGPSIPTDTPGARTSEIAHSDAGGEGQLLYQNLGCAACHTQLVRPVVADVGLGAVTLNDSNQVLGSRRFGPDLSDVGSRLGADELEDIISGGESHGLVNLSSGDMDDLISYLLESRTGTS